MHTVRLSLFCTAALLVNGAYANEFSGSAGASIKTTEFVVPASGGAHVGTLQGGSNELHLQASRAARATDDGQWVRISEPGDTATAHREQRPADNTPRWVF